MAEVIRIVIAVFLIVLFTAIYSVFDGRSTCVQFTVDGQGHNYCVSVKR